MLDSECRESCICKMLTFELVRFAPVFAFVYRFRTRDIRHLRELFLLMHQSHLLHSAQVRGNTIDSGIHNVSST